MGNTYNLRRIEFRKIGKAKFGGRIKKNTILPVPYWYWAEVKVEIIGPYSWWDHELPDCSKVIKVFLLIRAASNFFIFIIIITYITDL